MVCTSATPALERTVASSPMVLRARILDGAGRPVRATDVVGIKCSIWDVDSYVRFAAMDANPYEVVLRCLTQDASWTIDNIGYNFRHNLTDLADFAILAIEDFIGRVEVRYDFALIDCTRATVSFYLKLR
jgi:hypothetical protein